MEFSGEERKIPKPLAGLDEVCQYSSRTINTSSARTRRVPQARVARYKLPWVTHPQPHPKPNAVAAHPFPHARLTTATTPSLERAVYGASPFAHSRTQDSTSAYS